MIMPGSHRSGRHPSAEEAKDSGVHLGAIPLLGPAGTLCVYDARLWVRALDLPPAVSAPQLTQPRASIFWQHQAGHNTGAVVDQNLGEAWRIGLFSQFSAPQVCHQPHVCARASADR